MPDTGCIKRLSDYGKKVRKMYDRHEISWAYYTKLMKKPKCWEYVRVIYG